MESAALMFVFGFSFRSYTTQTVVVCWNRTNDKTTIGEREFIRDYRIRIHQVSTHWRVIDSSCISSMDSQTRQRHATFLCTATAISVFTFDRNYEHKTSSLCKHHRSMHNETLATDSNFISFSGHKKLFKCHDTHHYDFHYQPVSSGSDGASTIKRRRRWRKVWINYHNRNNRIIALTTGGREGGRGVIRNSVNDPDKKFLPKAPWIKKKSLCRNLFACEKIIGLAKEKKSFSWCLKNPKWKITKINLAFNGTLYIEWNGRRRQVAYFGGPSLHPMQLQTHFRGISETF